MSTEIVVQKLRGLSKEVASLTEEQPPEAITKAIELLAEVGRLLTQRKRTNKYGAEEISNFRTAGTFDAFLQDSRDESGEA